MGMCKHNFMIWMTLLLFSVTLSLNDNKNLLYASLELPIFCLRNLFSKQGTKKHHWAAIYLHKREMHKLEWNCINYLLSNLIQEMI